MEASSLKMKIFYDKDGIIVRRSIKTDVEYLKNHLSQGDLDEVWASNNLTAEKALKESVKQSLISLTISNGNPIGIFGISTKNIIGSKATIWLLGTDNLKKIKIFHTDYAEEKTMPKNLGFRYCC